MTVGTTLSKVETKKIVESWVTRASRADTKRRRQQARLPFVFPATVSNGGMEIRAVCRDISKEGLGVLLSECPAPNGRTIVSVCLQHRLVDLDVKFTWTKRLAKGWWAAGGRLELSSIDNARIAYSRIGREIERRVNKRYPFCDVFSVYGGVEQREDSCICHPNANEKPTIGIGLDISCREVRLLSEMYFEPDGQIIHVSAGDRCGSSKRIRGRIVSCLEMCNGLYVARLQFAPSRLLMKSVFS